MNETITICWSIVIVRYGAELHYLAATAQQCLGALAESAVANGDVACAAAITELFVAAIERSEDGWMPMPDGLTCESSVT